MSQSTDDLFSLQEGDAYCWAEQQSTVMLKAVTRDGDPVELSKEEAIEFAQALVKAAEKID